VRALVTASSPFRQIDLRAAWHIPLLNLPIAPELAFRFAARPLVGATLRAASVVREPFTDEVVDAYAAAVSADPSAWLRYYRGLSRRAVLDHTVRRLRARTGSAARARGPRTACASRRPWSGARRTRRPRSTSPAGRARPRCRPGPRPRRRALRPRGGPARAGPGHRRPRGFRHRLRTRFLELFDRDLELHHDAVTTLRRLAEAGVPVAVASSSSHEHVDRVLARGELTELVPVVVGADDVPLHKPDPTPYVVAAQRLGVEPTRCTAVEDTPVGVAAAVGAGMFTVAVVRAHGDPDGLAEAHRIVDEVTVEALLPPTGEGPT
jgi:HAD superfamily hydrolase (TIGR01509 family)